LVKNVLFLPTNFPEEPKVTALTGLIDEKTSRQNEIDKAQEVVSQIFENIENISPAQIDKIISVSYSRQALAKSSNDLLHELKTSNA